MAACALAQLSAPVLLAFDLLSSSASLRLLGVGDVVNEFWFGIVCICSGIALALHTFGVFALYALPLSDVEPDDIVVVECHHIFMLPLYPALS